MHEEMTKNRLVPGQDRSNAKSGACLLCDPMQSELIYNSILAGIMVHNPDSSVLFANAKAREIFGADSDILAVGQTITGWSLFDESGGRIELCDYPVNQAISRREPVEDVVIKYRRTAQPDEYLWLRMNAIPLINKGNLEQVVVSFVDITREYAATIMLMKSEERLSGTITAYRESEDCFRAIFENAVSGILILLPDQKIINANTALEYMLGYPLSELKDYNLWDISFPDDFELDRELLQDVIEGRRQFYQIEKRYVCKSGALIWGMLTVSVVRDESGEPSFIINMIEDISASKFAEEQLHFLNTHDSMTGLRNRAWFDEQLTHMQFGMQLPVSVISLDLDGLKKINDSQGHEAGDSLIIGAATILREAFRDLDIAARLGGDEFGALLPATGEAAAMAIMERIRECQAEFNSARQEPQPQVHFSIGTATANTSEEIAYVCKEADDRMYIEKAKRKRLQSRLA